MRYGQYADILIKVTERRRDISLKGTGLIPLKGYEKEFDALTKKADIIRRKMRRIRYGEE